MSTVAIVTGGSSGIGLATVQALKRRGCTVYSLSRHIRPGHTVDAEQLACDVSDEAQVRAAVEQVLAREGKIDILVNNAGFGISGAAEFTKNADARRLLDVNLFGVVNGCKAVIPAMRDQGRGRIVNLSSVAAPCAIPFQIWYSVSKAAVSTYSAALQNEVRPFGISVCSILPGDIQTGFTAAREKNPMGDEIYAGRIARSVSIMEHDEQNGMSPATAGDYIAKIALRRRVKPEYAIGLQYKCFVLLARLLPCGLKNRIIGWIYAK